IDDLAHGQPVGGPGRADDGMHVLLVHQFARALRVLRRVELVVALHDRDLAPVHAAGRVELVRGDGDALAHVAPDGRGDARERSEQADLDGLRAAGAPAAPATTAAATTATDAGGTHDDDDGERDDRPAQSKRAV